MPDKNTFTPARDAAKMALEKVFDCIRRRQNFRLEAGAGAGKTYSLIEALQFIIKNEGNHLQRANKQVACITYTNVATDEIKSRTDSRPLVHASTIHSFCWPLIRRFQQHMRTLLPELKGWKERLDAVQGAEHFGIKYELGHSSIREADQLLLLGHDDVIRLTTRLMEHQKFRSLISARFPILFIDEYQDTNRDFAESLVKHFIRTAEGPLIGFFGDSWQKIYGDGCGSLEDAHLATIGKEANFRSVQRVVDVLNKVRQELQQFVDDVETRGSALVAHSNGWSGQRLNTPHWKGDLPANDAHEYLSKFRAFLELKGWSFENGATKVLMLTHNVLAREQGYRNVAAAFRYNDSFAKKEDPHIAFFVDALEPACRAYKRKRYGEMFAALGSRNAAIKTLAEKRQWIRDMDCLLDLQATGTIGEILEHLSDRGRPRLPIAIEKIRSRLATAFPEEVEDSTTLTAARKLSNVRYREIVALTDYLAEHSPFSTKHGVKGAEFENVLIVLGRGWNLYNWNQFLEWSASGAPKGKQDSYERNRNLFYVACSRARKRLALLFTQELSEAALGTLDGWFGADAVLSLSSCEVGGATSFQLGESE